MNSIVSQEKKWLLEEKYHGIPTDKYKLECELLEQGMPVAYLIGNIEFLGCHIDLASKPLIPRAETEYWVDLCIKHLQAKYSKVELGNLNILDVFAGSGCIGIACAKHLDAHVDFGELQKQNLDQILQNTSYNKCMTKTRIFPSDVFSNIPEKKYDIILANPPYIDKAKEMGVQTSVLDNEDHVALFAEQQGLSYVFQLIQQATRFINSQGELWIEFDPWQVPLIDEYMQGNKDWSHSYLQDQYEKNRVLILKRQQ